jgi:hypothetical protein
VSKFFLLFVLAVLALPAVALAKGPDYALLSGPGISGSIRIDGDGEGAGTATPLGALVTYGGFFPQMFGHHFDEPTTRVRPSGTLGPRYEVVYSVPTPTGRSTIESDVYPYARPPVTYMKPGQPFYEMHTYGGWYVAKPGLKRTLVEAGLPGVVAGGTSHTWRWMGIGALAFGAVACASAFVLRRRPQSAPAPAS